MIQWLNNEQELIIKDIIKYNDVELFNILLLNDNINYILTIKDAKGKTLLYYCVIYNNLNMFKLLQEKDFDINTID